ncbi:MAG TPA: hypothetical protein P5218_00410 [Planctomycetota bacterium]|nr:hypothetical protein [Planctomycetota bacterium]
MLCTIEPDTLSAMCSLRVLLVLVFSSLSLAQVPIPDGAASKVPGTRVERSAASLSALQRTRETKQAALDKLNQKLSVTTLEDERTTLLAQKHALQAELDRLSADFESIATGIDVANFDLTQPDSFDLQAEVQKLIQPLIEELKDATEEPRQIERLRSQIDYLVSREELASQALKSIETLISDLDPSDPQGLRPALLESRDGWKHRMEEAHGQLTVARFQLESRLSSRKSIISSTQSALGDFFRTRGLNLLLAIATFFLVLVVLRGAYRKISKLLPTKNREERHFYARLIDVLYFLFVTAIAVVAALLVLYATGDWVLLGITLLFLVGVAWAFKTAVPMFLEQIRLLLNLGTVRERERVMIEGIPYRVSKLSFYTLLSNPNLAGGVRRLPLKDLTDMRSRTCSKDEIWFPSHRGDWVLLSDGRRGEVKHQSPDMVQIELLGGSRVTYSSSEFLGLAPENLSVGFRRQIRFGIDYAHQAISTTQVPAIFATQVERGLRKRFGADSVKSLKVEFVEAGASSLDYQVFADMDGSCASQFDAIARAMQTLCVETCNEQGWTIPFTQITVHQAVSH